MFFNNIYFIVRIAGTISESRSIQMLDFFANSYIII